MNAVSASVMLSMPSTGVGTCRKFLLPASKERGVIQERGPEHIVDLRPEPRPSLRGTVVDCSEIIVDDVAAIDGQ